MVTIKDPPPLRPPLLCLRHQLCHQPRLHPCHHRPLPRRSSSAAHRHHRFRRSDLPTSGLPPSRPLSLRLPGRPHLPPPPTPPSTTTTTTTTTTCIDCDISIRPATHPPIHPPTHPSTHPPIHPHTRTRTHTHTHTHTHTAAHSRTEPHSILAVAARWNAVRYMLAAMHMLYFGLRDVGPTVGIDDEEWAVRGARRRSGTSLPNHCNTHTTDCSNTHTTDCSAVGTSSLQHTCRLLCTSDD